MWNRNFVSSVQLTMAEDFGVGTRGAFYDTAGAVRDVIQNHLLQIVALLAMEPPTGPDADALRDEKVKVFRQIATIDPANLVRGQYRGYVDEPGVTPGSDTETFAAVRFEIDSWRWSGVPWLIRAGKELPVTATEAVITFHEPPRLLFVDPDSPAPEPNRLRFRISPDDGVVLHLFSKEPGDRMVAEPLDLAVEYEAVYGQRHDAYRRLLEDALEGDQRRFGRADTIREQWRIVDRLIKEAPPVRFYESGTWGPDEADRTGRGRRRLDRPDHLALGASSSRSSAAAQRARATSTARMVRSRSSSSSALAWMRVTSVASSRWRPRGTASSGCSAGPDSSAWQRSRGRTVAAATRYPSASSTTQMPPGRTAWPSSASSSSTGTSAGHRPTKPTPPPDRRRR